MEMKTTVLADSLKFPEGPRWHEGKLWCCDFFAQRIVHVDLQGRVETVVELQDTPTATGWTPAGKLLVVSAFARRLLRLDDDGLAFPNGMVITPDRQTLIVAESHATRLTAFTIEPDGSLSGRRVWAQFEDRGDFGASEGQITPDGICLDAEGAVWIASPNTRDVLRVREGAEITQRIPLDTIPLACMLGGPERRTLFIATTESLDPSDSNSKGRIETIEVDVPGAGLP